MDIEVEQAILKLVTLCKEKNYVLTGVLSNIESVLVGFDSDKENTHFTEEVNNIRTLVKTKGNIEQFLMELSALDVPFYETEVDGQASTFVATNPQIYKTQH